MPGTPHPEPRVVLDERTEQAVIDIERGTERLLDAIAAHPTRPDPHADPAGAARWHLEQAATEAHDALDCAGALAGHLYRAARYGLDTATRAAAWPAAAAVIALSR